MYIIRLYLYHPFSNINQPNYDNIRDQYTTRDDRSMRTTIKKAQENTSLCRSMSWQNTSSKGICKVTWDRYGQDP